MIEMGQMIHKYEDRQAHKELRTKAIEQHPCFMTLTKPTNESKISRGHSSNLFSIRSKCSKKSAPYKRTS